jgi:hypothetical protein
MRLRVAIEFAVNDQAKHMGGCMSDWIDRMKSTEERNSQFNQEQTASRLHKAKMILAKAPRVWEVLIGQIKEDSEKLNRTFPDDTSRQCDFIQRDLEYTLQNRQLPIRILSLSLNLNGHQIDMREATKHSIEYQPVLKPESPVLFKLDANDNLQFEWFGKLYVDPALLSEQFIKRVCGIKL